MAGHSPSPVAVTPQALQAYRSHTFRLLPSLRITSIAEAIEFVNARGFVYFWPIKDVVLPSLWHAVVGDRPVASEHDDPGHVTWGWKDASLGKRRWHYAKVLRGRATVISLAALPYFYALSENYGDPTADYLQQYEDGLLSNEAKQIYETLLREGPLDTVNLRRAARMTAKTSNAPFERGLTELQRDFKILPVGVAETGAWRYSFIYELTHRHYPDLAAQARPISTRAARQRLALWFFDAVGAAAEAEARRLFQWRPDDVRTTLAALAEDGRLQRGADGVFLSPALLAHLGC